MLFSPEERERAIALWKCYIRPTIGTRECNRFVRATKNPSNPLAEEIIVSAGERSMNWSGRKRRTNRHDFLSSKN
jgi:hypothetical protein